MSKKHLIAVAVVVVATFVVFAGTSGEHVQGQPDLKATVVEYKVVRFSGSKSLTDLTMQLNDLAQNGWQRAFVVAKGSQETGNKRSDKYNRVTNSYTLVAYQRPAAPAKQAE